MNPVFLQMFFSVESPHRSNIESIDLIFLKQYTQTEFFAKNMRTSLRSQKTASLVQDRLAQIFTELFMPDEVGILSMTQIEISGDLGIIEVTVSAIGSPEPDMAQFLQFHARKILQKILQKVPFRRAPILRFKNAEIQSLTSF